MFNLLFLQQGWFPSSSSSRRRRLPTKTQRDHTSPSVVEWVQLLRSLRFSLRFSLKRSSPNHHLSPLPLSTFLSRLWTHPSSWTLDSILWLNSWIPTWHSQTQSPTQPFLLPVPLSCLASLTQTHLLARCPLRRTLSWTNIPSYLHQVCAVMPQYNFHHYHVWELKGGSSVWCFANHFRWSRISSMCCTLICQSTNCLKQICAPWFP